MAGGHISRARFGPAFPGERGGRSWKHAALLTVLRKDSKAEVAACHVQVGLGCFCPGYQPDLWQQSSKYSLPSVFRQGGGHQRAYVSAK